MGCLVFEGKKKIVMGKGLNGKWIVIGGLWKIEEIMRLIEK